MLNTILLSLIVIFLAALLGIIIFSLLKVKTGLEMVRDYITPPGDGENSPLVNELGTIADMFSKAVMMNAKATFMGMQSGAKRGERAAAAEVAEATIGGVNPLIGMLMKSFPAVGKSLAKNPELLDLALTKLMPGTGAQLPDTAAGGNGHSNSAYKLQ